MKKLIGIFSRLNIGVYYIVISAVAFSTMEIVSKTIIHQINPFQVNFIRFSAGGIFLLPFALAELHRRKIKLNLRDFLFLGLTGLIGIAVSMTLFQESVMFAKASVVSVIFSANPVFTLPLAMLFLKEKLSLVKYISFGISILGVACILNPFAPLGEARGILLAVGAAACFSLYSVIGKLRLAYYGGLILNCFSFLFGGVILGICMAIWHIPFWAGVDKSTMPALVYLSLVVTGVGYLTYFAAMKHTSTITTSSVFFIKPILAPLLAFAFLEETLSVNLLMGIVCILVAAGILLFENRLGKNHQISRAE